MHDLLLFLQENRTEVGKQTLEHIQLSLVSLFLSTIVGVILGVFIGLYKKSSKIVLTFVNIIQTVPSLALLGFLLPFLGIGTVPAIIALFLYALLPIVRNTFTGILEVDEAVVESATAMGMGKMQLLWKVQLPLALPYIMAGIRTASVINVGVATLSAFIAAGGLGKFILQGIQLNNTNMILAGAIPASLLALSFDYLLGLFQRLSLKNLKFVSLGFALVLVAYLSYQATLGSASQKESDFKAGFPSEFIYREDGLQKLEKRYGLDLNYVEMEIGLMYKALAEKEVDLISGFSTDGRISLYDLVILEDDKKFFPPYEAVPIYHADLLDDKPSVAQALKALANTISTEEMIRMNFLVDEEGMKPEVVARQFLENKGLIEKKDQPKRKSAEIVKIGSKAFTENYILAHLFKEMILWNTPYQIEMQTGFGGTKLVMDALKTQSIDIYPEYTGTALMLLLNVDNDVRDSLLNYSDQVYPFVQDQLLDQFDLKILPSLGFSNTFALMVRRETAENYKLTTISDLKLFQ